MSNLDTMPRLLFKNTLNHNNVQVQISLFLQITYFMKIKFVCLYLSFKQSNKRLTKCHFLVNFGK